MVFTFFTLLLLCLPCSCTQFMIFLVIPSTKPRLLSKQYLELFYYHKLKFCKNKCLFTLLFQDLKESTEESSRNVTLCLFSRNQNPPAPNVFPLQHKLNRAVPAFEQTSLQERSVNKVVTKEYWEINVKRLH